MPGHPYLLDNLGDDTRHDAGLAYLVGDIPPGHDLSVAVGYVNLDGLHHLALAVETNGGCVSCSGPSPTRVWAPSSRHRCSIGQSRDWRRIGISPVSRPAEPRKALRRLSHG